MRAFCSAAPSARLSPRASTPPPPKLALGRGRHERPRRSSHPCHGAAARDNTGERAGAGEGSRTRHERDAVADDAAFAQRQRPRGFGGGRAPSGISPTSCAKRSTSQARIWVASMGFAGPAPLLVDGEPVRSCITFAGACGGADVTTIEGLDNDEIAVELRAAFNREHALQCGFCTPGMLVSARDLVLRLREPDERRIRLGLSGNLCRCTGYVGIVQAVRSVIAARRERGIAPIVAASRARLGTGRSADRIRPGDRRARAEDRARRAFPRSLRKSPRRSPRQTVSNRLSLLADPRRRCSRRLAASARSRIAFPARSRRRAGAGPGRGRHSRQIRADLAGLPRGGP